MVYLVKTPVWVSKLYGRYIWQMPDDEKIIYLSFDDGPHNLVTPFVLDELNKYNAKASFFCIGKNVLENPEIYQRILNEGHTVGNHTQNHLDGWKTENSVYLANVLEARKHINSEFFRPPYGRITKSQQQKIAALQPAMKVIMWSVLSGDFDKNLTAEQCCTNVLENSKSGSIVVFHDSQKAFERLKYALPIVLKHFADLGFSFKKISFSKE